MQLSQALQVAAGESAELALSTCIIISCDVSWRVVPSAGQLLTSAQKAKCFTRRLKKKLKQNKTSLKAIKMLPDLETVTKLATLDITICPFTKSYLLYKF